MNDTALERFLRKEEDVQLNSQIQARKTMEIQERAAALQARVTIKQIQVNTALQTLQLAVNARAAATDAPNPVREEIVEQANTLLGAAMKDEFYEMSETSE
jgi:hypothetical protein